MTLATLLNIIDSLDSKGKKQVKRNLDSERKQKRQNNK